MGLRLEHLFCHLSLFKCAWSIWSRVGTFLGALHLTWATQVCGSFIFFSSSEQNADAVVECHFILHVVRSHHIVAHPKKFFVSCRTWGDSLWHFCKCCIYMYIYCLSYLFLHFLDVNIGILLSPLRVWLTKQSVFCCTYFIILIFYKHLNLMQTFNGLYIQCANIKYVQLCSRWNDFVTQAPFTCCMHCITA